MSELKGLCPRCGAHYWGYVLTNPPRQKCARCGSDLEIAENGIHIRSHYSSLTTKTYKMASIDRRRYGGGSTIIN